MILKDGKMGWLYPGRPKGLGDAMQHVGTSKAQHLSKFVEFYKSVSENFSDQTPFANFEILSMYSFHLSPQRKCMFLLH